MRKDGKCGEHTYPGYTQAKIDKLMEEMKKLKFTVTGNNPWDVDTHKFSVKLRGWRDEKADILSVIVTNKSFLAPCKKVWEKIDPILKHFEELPESESG